MKKWLKKRNKMEQKRGKHKSREGNSLLIEGKEKKGKTIKRQKKLKFKQKLKERKVIKKKENGQN